jgi:serine/threonine-protein kinase
LSAPSGGTAQARLFSLLPPGYAPGVCKSITPPQGALAEMSCEKNSDPDGPQSAIYALYPDTISLRNALSLIIQASNIIECPGRIQSPGPWHRIATPGNASGVLLCAIHQDNPVVGWTNEAELLISMATAAPPGPSIDHLYTWWMSHS